MTVTTNAQGRDRKQLVQTIAKWLDEPIRYAGAPTFNYEVGGVTINKDAELSFDAAFSDEAIERLLLHLNNEGYDIMKRIAQQTAMEHYGWSVERFIKEFGRNFL